MSKNSPDNTKAVSAGVSFRPGSLLARAKAYGSSQSPVLGYSAVVSQALDEFLSARGWGPNGSAVVAKQEMELLLEIKRIGLDPAAVLKAATRAHLAAQQPATSAA